MSDVPEGLSRLGLVVNPLAGARADENLRVAAAALRRLGATSVAAPPGELGGEAVWRSGAAWFEVPVPPAQERSQTASVVRALVSEGIDALVVVGGDGTLADAAGAVVAERVSVPLVGVGAGSTNVGPLVSVRPDHLGALDPWRLRPKRLDAVEVECHGQSLGLAFHDAVLGFTAVGTVDGRLRDVDVAARLRGNPLPGRPRPVGMPGTVVSREGSGGPATVASGEWVATVVVAFAKPHFVGHALAGAVCLSALGGLRWGCLIADRPLVQVEIGPEELSRWPPVRSAYVSLGDGDRVTVEGVAEGTAVVADGNPLRLLRPEDRVAFSLLPGAVTVLRPDGQEAG